ncbi:hypothetical protein BpHYR1_020405 [Brachionus plicatilis]|uniref:Uncharacterized protein n=1 Tax=Brachionus plicatilis TaxID=10195 RepID=A0A3M7R7D9_BRAPC|nr:hypothetical protein BpHYR1_020405 [Brachionus plicatilis]
MQWIRILPRVGLGKRSPDKISSSLMSRRPSRKSMYKSLTLYGPSRTKCEFIHLEKVFFWTISRSSANTWMRVRSKSRAVELPPSSMLNLNNQVDSGQNLEREEKYEDD